MFGEREYTEEELEVGRAVSELITKEGRPMLKIRWTTGKTSAGRLFGRYGRGGKPDFFRLLFGVVSGSLRGQYGSDKGEEVFNAIRDSERFRRSTQELFNQMKEWFFNEVVPRIGLEKGDIFVITTELELDPETGEITWNKDSAQVVYWVRSDKCAPRVEEARAAEYRERLEEVENKLKELSDMLKGCEADRLRAEEKVRELQKRLEEELTVKREEAEKARELREENRRLSEENRRLKEELNEARKALNELKASLDKLRALLGQ